MSKLYRAFTVNTTMTTTTKTTTTVLRPFVRDYPGESVPEETLKPRLHATTCCQNRFHNRLYPEYKHSTGCQTRLTTGCIVYTAGCQTGCQTGCTTRFDNRLNEQWLFVQNGCQTGCQTCCIMVWHLAVSCKQTSNRLSIRLWFDILAFTVNMYIILHSGIALPCFCTSYRIHVYPVMTFNLIALSLFTVSSWFVTIKSRKKCIIFEANVPHKVTKISKLSVVFILHFCNILAYFSKLIDWFFCCPRQM